MIRPLDFFVLRTPLLPFDALASWTAEDGAGEPTRERLRAHLRAYLAMPDVREAIWLASPSLDASIAAWQSAPDSDKGLKAERALVRYFSRMAARPTPFGLFAGCSVGTWGAHTDLRLAPRDRHRRHTRLDTDYVAELCESLGQKPDVRRRLRLRPNTTAHFVGDRVRFIEAHTQKRSRDYQLVSVEATPALRLALELSADGSERLALADAIARRLAVDATAALAFVDGLVDHQLLVSDLEPLLTGSEPVPELIAQLTALDAAPEARAALARTRDRLAQLDARPLGSIASEYADVIADLTTLPTPVDAARLFQADLHGALDGSTLDGGVVEDIAAGVALLERLRRGGADQRLRAFCQRFVERFGSGEVPLLHVLDEEMGIGFGGLDELRAEASPLVAALPWPATPAPPPAWEARDALLLGWVERALHAGTRVVTLDDRDLAELPAASAPLPRSFAALCTIAAEGPVDSVRKSYKVYVKSVDGPCGAALLGRFCHGDAQLLDRVRALVRDEEAAQPDALFAEVVHLPEGRHGNVLLRPLLRDYEIPLLGRSGAPPERQLALADLRVSVAGERVLLRSERLGREVIPRLTMAHNHVRPRSLALYRFLGAVQRQPSAQSHFDWGALGKMSFLPRLEYGRVVLTLARWRLDAATLRTIDGVSGRARFAAMQEVRGRLKLPRWLVVGDGDRRLPLDLDNRLSVDGVLEIFKGRSEAVLREMFPAPDELWLRGPEGRFVHELVVPLTSEPPASTSPVRRRSAPVVRAFTPGSEWLYAKLYAAPTILDRLLRELVAQLLATIRPAVPRWFFLRYADPGWHLRLRLHGEARVLLGETWPRMVALLEPWRAADLVTRVQLDTYEREVERYGGARAIDIAEQIFTADSDAALQLVVETNSEARWQAAALGVDRLLEDFGIVEPAAKLAFAEPKRDAFARELHSDVALARELGKRYRQQATPLEALLCSGGPFAKALAERSRRIAPLAAMLRAAADSGELEVALPSLIGSFVHMHVNRMVASSPRAHELVLYDYLCRQYRSRIKRRGGQ